ncbi:MAG: hypothetical protein R6U61_06465 [Thermoplasmata archaeon]
MDKEHMEKWGDVTFHALIDGLTISSVGTAYILADINYIQLPSLPLELSTILFLTPFLMTMFMGFLLSRYSFKTIFASCILACMFTIILTFSVLVWLPQILFNVEILGGVMLYGRDTFFFVLFPSLPGIFAGGLLGAYLSEYIPQTYSTKEETYLKKEMKEWVDYLEQEIEKKGRGKNRKRYK